MSSQLTFTGQGSYDQLLSWTGHPAAVIKCTIQDIYEASTIRRNHSYAEPIFLLDQCPFRNVDIVGWISSLTYVPFEKEHEDPTMRLVMSIDDGNGSFVLPVSKTLKYDLVNRKRPAHVETSLPEFSKANGERYITIADRKKQAKTKVKRHRYPDLSVGDIVRIRGRMKEWSRRNGEVIREVVVDQDGGSLSTVTAWDEHLHFEEVRRRKREIYNVVFQGKVYESLLAPLQPTASQLPVTQLALPKSFTQDRAASSQLSIFDPSGNSSIFSSSASQPSATLRHPCKLSRDHLNDNQFRRYLMEYLRIQTELHWCADLESERAISEAARYMPELAWPTREVAAYQAEVERQRRKRAQMFEVDDLADLEATPRAGKTRHGRVEVERRRPLTPVKFNGRRLSSPSSGTESQQEAANCSFGIEHLVHVPHLRILAHRFVRLEQGKENELYMARRQELKAAGRSMSQQSALEAAAKGKKPAYGSVYRDSRARRAERGWKMRKLFQHCFRLMVATDGSVVEVEMSERDREAVRAEAAARRARRGALASFEVSFDSNGSALADRSSIGDTSSVNSSLFDYSLWAAPSGFTGHPSDSDSAGPTADKRVTAIRSDGTGYLPLTLPVLGMALLHVLHCEAFARSTVYIPHSDRRRGNGMSAREVSRALARLHARWERVQLAVVEDGLEDLEAGGWVRKYGDGWWPTRSRLPGVE
ncbi:hypothetical protein NCC49_000499 [Naganishia albida]|nr:hypothetical protein NCC49_000499 [Naganishia albida]